MKKVKVKILALMLVFVTVISSLAVPVFALNWDGSSTGGGGNGTAATVNGYAIRTTDDNCIGYRFSAVDKTGANKVTKVIDVFRNTAYGNSEYSDAYKFTTKYNKKQLINNQNSGFNTSSNTTNCYKESNMGFATALPATSGMKTWQNNTTNLNKILSTLGVGSISNLKNGDKIIVEPIYDIKIEKIYHAVTVTETAIYGKYLLGASSNGGASYVADSWGFISYYTNKYYPNELYTPDGQGLWTGVSAASDQLTFYNIINKGYGVGIAYTETKSDYVPSLVVQLCEVWAGTVASRGSIFGTTNGNAFANYSYSNGYPSAGGSVNYSVRFAKETENCYVKQTVWIDGTQKTNKTRYSNEGSYDYTYLKFDGASSIPTNKSYYTVKGRVDWIDSKGTVLKYGTEKSFYIPVKPTVYRYQVTAINCEGDVQAYNGSGGSSGKVYVGQKVSAKYKYTAKNTWASSDYVYAAMHKWNGSSWVKVASSADVPSTKVSLSSTKSQELNSSLGYVRVPDNSGSGKNVMHCKLITSWASDSEHTGETTWIDIPISKPDVELNDIYLADKNGNVVDETDLEVGQVVTVYHVYKNNTDTKVFVNGFNNDKSQISGVFAIPAKDKITVAGASYTVPNKRSFSIWGGVYLEGAGIGKTDWESNPDNNTFTLQCKCNSPVTIVPIVPNAAYRENTDVITSFRIYNSFTDDYIPSDNLQVRFTVSKVDGTKIRTETKTVAVKANGNNLVYFRWSVPTGLNGANVVVKAEILEGGTAYNPKTNNRSTTPYTYYKTPDTKFEEKAPDGFTVPSAPTKSQNYATWTEYSYEGGKFVEKSYGIGVAASSSATLTPATGKTATKDAGGKWTMKSGYGVWLEAGDSVLGVSGYLTPVKNAYTDTQYACALYPEYGYKTGANKCTTLYLNGSLWCFNKLNAAKTNKEYHYTPLYFPDGKYIVKVVKSDMWTPAGMVQSVDTTTPITIAGNAYDDWYIQH